MTSAKPFVIPKRLVWEAYQRVKANRGSAGIDGQSIKDFDLKYTTRNADKKIKALEKELIRKEKALAETAALLVLRKKAQAIWEESEDE